MSGRVASRAAFYRRAERRSLRAEAHAIFDRLWKEGHMTRTEAYRWLASEFDLPRRRAHIGMMPRDLLREVPLRVKAKLYALESER